MMIQIEAQNEYPSISLILRGLEENGTHFSRDYVMMLKRKIEAERGKRIDFQILGRELSRIEDKFKDLMYNLYSIVRDDKAKPIEKIAAAKTIGELEKNLMNIKFDAGMFKRHIGKVEVEETAEDRIVKRIIEIDDGRGKISENTQAPRQLTAGNPQ